MRLSARVLAETESPITSAYNLIALRGGRRPLLDLAQAAPGHPPAPSVVERVLATARDPHGADYVGGAGLELLREAFADELSSAYAGAVRPTDVAVTAGCNQAFCLVASALAEPGDEIVLALPYYFNHDMWLRMHGVRPVYLPPGPGLVPDAAAAAELLTPRTRAIVLVTPGNPTGVTIPPANLAAFAETARRHGIALILDETYRTFRDRPDTAPHSLFADPAWRDVVISLHSFSKDHAIPGYRVGAVVAAPRVQNEVLKLLDCVAIGAPRIGQEAALAGITTSGTWRAERAGELAQRRRSVATAFQRRPGGFEMLSCGGYFAWVRHPWPERATTEVVRTMLQEQDLLAMPGTAFGPDDTGTIRLSVGPLGAANVADLGERLVALASPDAPSGPVAATIPRHY